MLRYLRRLSDRDLALDRTMIPLGSCTMKLNPTTSMEAISLPGFANLHPFAPVHQSLGYTDGSGDDGFGFGYMDIIKATNGVVHVVDRVRPL